MTSSSSRLPATGTWLSGWLRHEQSTLALLRPGLRESDEFTVPLGNGHHDSLHQTGDERAWWARHGIRAPLQIAERLWAASHPGRHTAVPTPRKPAVGDAASPTAEDRH